MAVRKLEDFLSRLKSRLAVAPSGESSDCQLLEHYASQRDEAAFTSLVRRHGSLVLGVARRILRHDQDAEDVFQATFLILARKSVSLHWQKSIAGWLYRVAYRLAMRTRANRVRQRSLQRDAGMACATVSKIIEDGPERFAVLDEELHRLSERCREPLLLCYFEGKTRDQAAQQLGWSLRTLERRLQQGLKLLRARLSKRGIELPAALLAAGLSQQTVSATTIAATVAAATKFGSSTATAGGAISAQVAALTEGGLKAMAVSTMKTKMVLLAAASILLVGVCAVGQRMLATQKAEKNPSAQERATNTPQPTIVNGRVVFHRGTVPRPASLDIHFDPGLYNADKLPFKGVSFQVLRQIQGNSYLAVARDAAPSVRRQLKLSDLSPGIYLVDVRTEPKPETKKLPGTEINPGSYFDQKKLVLKAGQSERVDFRYEPFDPQAYRGQRTAVLHIHLPDGAPAAGRELKVEYQGSHYGSQVVFAGRLPKSGEVTIKGLTDRVPPFCPNRIAYVVTVDRETVGQFGFTKEGPAQEFEFHLAPRAGDRAPEIVLRNVATGKPIKLSSLRGKVVCLEFWATWCGPCQPAMAKLNRLSAERSAAWKDRVVLIPVSIDTAVDRVKSHVSSRGWDRVDHFWTGDKTGTGWDSHAARAFGVFGVPETILIGSDGRIVWRGHPESKSGGHDLKSRIESELVK